MISRFVWSLMMMLREAEHCLTEQPDAYSLASEN